MRKLHFYPLFLLVCTGLFAQNVTLEQAVQSSAQTINSRLKQGSVVAVLTFTSTSQTFSDYIIDEIATAIDTGNKIKVVERHYTDIIRKEFNIQLSGDVGDDQIKSLGKQLGAQYVITGSLVDIGNAYRFRVFVIDVESAVREASASININVNDPQVVFFLTGQRPNQQSTNPFVGKWRSTESASGRETLVCILNLFEDGRIVVEQYGTTEITNANERR